MSKPSHATLYLIPVTLADVPHSTCLPAYNADVVRQLRYFIVENVRTARRFIKAVDRSIDVEALTFYELNKHTDPKDIASYLGAMAQGESVGVISEAGCPAVADPGSDVVAMAQSRGYRVVPLVGPSSILLALMASGFNGQGFAFRGYLPIEADKRAKAIREMEQRVMQGHETQICIETPYRNAKLFEDLLRQCRSETMLCVACELTAPEAYVRTMSIGQWRKHTAPDLHKRPCIFLLG